MVRSANYQKNQPPQGQSDFFDEIAGLLGELMLKACFGLLVLAWLALLFPMLSLPVAGSVALGWWLGWPYGVAAGVATVALWAVWRMCWPVSFERWVTGRMRQMYWKWWRYTRRWTSLMALQHLTAELDGRVKTPVLISARIGRVVDVLEVGMVDGQKVETWEQRAEELRHSFRALGLRVRHTASGRVRVEVIHTDILRKPIPLPRVPGGSHVVDLEAVTVGVTQLGEPWRLELLGTHLLGGGATGAGKGSVAWSIIAGLGPAIAAGTVVVWVIDPKGGAEFGFGAGWFDRFAYDNTHGALELLREAARVMLARLARIRYNPERKVYPSVDEPMILLIIDEAASLTEYYADRKVKEEIERLLGLILTMGRAAGVVVVGFVQDPSKEVMRLRQLYPTRIALRQDESTQVAMLLGPTARDRGALADLISRRTPGVGFVQITPGADLTDAESNETEELTAQIERVRAFNVTDADIGWIIGTYNPPRRYEGDTVAGEPVVIDLDDYLSSNRDGSNRKPGGDPNRKGRTA
jgi:S-DNA-T family DNA segregation ATPase FtsK/SpoIIIE